MSVDKHNGNPFEQSDLATRCVRGGLTPDPSTGAIVTPIFQTATYVQAAIGEHKGHTYSRASNPTVSALEANLGGLEACPPSVCFATGLADPTRWVDHEPPLPAYAR